MKSLKSSFRQVLILVFAAFIAISAVILIDNKFFSPTKQEGQVAGTATQPFILNNKFCDNPETSAQKSCTSFIPSALAQAVTTYQNVGGDVQISGKLDLIKDKQIINFLTGTSSSGYALQVGVNDNGINFSNNANTTAAKSINFKSIGTQNGMAGQTIKFLTGTNTSGYEMQVGLNDDTINFYNNSSSRGYRFKNPTGTLLDITSAGNLIAKGSITGTSKNFEIDHPAKPGYKLVHASLESPENAVFYKGEGQLQNGIAIVNLPDYFESLTATDNRTVLLTPKFDSDEPVSNLAASSVKTGKFTVRAIDNQNLSQKFYWEVKAVRRDIPPLVVEKIK